MPRPKPPFPAQKGLFGKPTVINNVETLAMVPVIIRDGAEAFRQYGPANSPGTKTFALTGHVANSGLIEVPFGTTLREIVCEIGGNVLDKNGNPTFDSTGTPITVPCSEAEIARKKAPIFTPGEMAEINLKPEHIKSLSGGDVTIKIEK